MAMARFRTQSVLISVGAVIMLLALPAGARDQITIFDHSGQERNGIALLELDTVYFDLGGFTEAMNIHLDWDYISDTAEITFHDHSLTLTPDVKAINFDGGILTVEAAPIERENLLWIPIDWIGDVILILYDHEFIWDPETLSIRIAGDAVNTESDVSRRYLIVLDPGHGGTDNGCALQDGSMEKTLVLRLAERLSTLLQDRLGMEVRLTRNGDTTATEEQRAMSANESHADFFLGLHLVPAWQLSGKLFAVFIPGERLVVSDSESPLHPWDRMDRKDWLKSLSFAKAAGKALSRASGESEWNLHEADIRILRMLSMPGCIVEFSDGAAFYGSLGILTEEGMGRVAEALFDAVKAAIEMDENHEN